VTAFLPWQAAWLEQVRVLLYVDQCVLVKMCIIGNPLLSEQTVHTVCFFSCTAVMVCFVAHRCHYIHFAAGDLGVAELRRAGCRLRRVPAHW